MDSGDNCLAFGRRVCELNKFFSKHRKRKPGEYEAIRLLWNAKPGDTIKLQAKETKDGKEKIHTIE